MCKTYIVKNYKTQERYSVNEWNKEYIKYLKYLYLKEYPKEDSAKNPYNDPDDVRHKEFYNDLAQFLNDRERKVELKEKWTYEFDDKNNGIKVKDKDDKWIFTIFSDQFGFSAPSKNHPYDIYAEINDYDIKALERISEYVYYTRTLGGSFLWPIDGGKGYNMARGGTSYYNDREPDDHYIEDRVDLTLLEIKKYYTSENAEYKDILLEYLSENIKKWLNHFGDFETYVNFFMFNSFVDDNYMPKQLLKNDKGVDILDGKSWTRIMKSDKRRNDIKLKNKQYKKDLEEAFESLKNWTVERTKEIEECSLKAMAK